MPEWLIMIFTSLITGGLIGLIQFLITRHDKKKDDKEEIKKKLDKNERDNIRLQLLFLITHFPDGVQEIMKCAEHYFRVLKGDWYMTSIFNKYLVSNDIAKPEWFDEND